MRIRCNVPIHASPAQLSTILHIRPLKTTAQTFISARTIGTPPISVAQCSGPRRVSDQWRSDGCRFLLQCPTSFVRPGCPSSEEMPEGGCGARTLPASQRNFQEQKGWLQELLEQAHQEVIPHPKFHCELNFIERFWCGAKFYSREHCGYSFESLREVLPAALDSVSTVSMYYYYPHSMRILNAYSNGLSYGTMEFVDKVYKGHRQVVDKTKW